jgi:hypothetical protein
MPFVIFYPKTGEYLTWPGWSDASPSLQRAKVFSWRTDADARLTSDRYWGITEKRGPGEVREVGLMVVDPPALARAAAEADDEEPGDGAEPLSAYEYALREARRNSNPHGWDVT